MLFQGQEFASSRPFVYFADHAGDLARQVREGRREFLAQFPSIARPEVLSRVPAPDDPAVFEACRLDQGERDRHPEAVALHRDLLRLRREDPVLRAQGEGGFDGAVLSDRAFALRWAGGPHGDRLLVVNLGHDVSLESAPEPTIAPPDGRRWESVWSSEDPRYGGRGAPAIGDGHWRMPAESAVLLRVEARS
jgi:maltooligosyltrehalose trehalohydrolase